MNDGALSDSIARRGGENFDLFHDYINPHFVQLLGLVGFGRRFVSSSGFELVDDEGRRYLDFLSGYGVHNIGHNHPAVKEALLTVLSRDIPSFTQVECSLLPGLAAEKLAGLLPDGLNRVFFCNSGAEAVDAAVKLARAATGRKRIICCGGAFHGNTLGVLGMTDNAGRRDRFRPLLPGIVRVPFDDLEALSKALRWKDAAALVVEPVLGEGGAIVPDRAYLPRALEICHRAGALLIVDEVQTGLGRTGRMFALEHSGLRPDAVALAKSLGGGLVPVGAMVARDTVFARAYGSLKTCLDHKTTFGGGALASAAVLAALEVVQSEGLVQAAQEQGRHLKAGLRALQTRHETIGEVRGVGLMLGIKFEALAVPGLRGPLRALVPGGLERASAELFAQHVVLKLLKEHRIVTQVAANDLGVLKVMPPLCITREAVDLFLERLDAVLASGGHAAAMVALARELLSNRSTGHNP